MAGITPTKDQVNLQAGGLCRDFDLLCERVLRYKAWLDATNLQEATYGFTAQDEAVIKSAFGDLAGLIAAYKGTATIGALKDHRTFPKQLWGTGI